MGSRFAGSNPALATKYKDMKKILTHLIITAILYGAYDYIRMGAPETSELRGLLVFTILIVNLVAMLYPYKEK